MDFKACKQLLAILLWIFLISFNSQGSASTNSKQITINIVFRDNLVGLRKDRNILQSELKKLGHHVLCTPPGKYRGSDKREIPEADINIFVEKIWSSFLPYAKKNYFIPNPEWCKASATEIRKKCDLILCRTHDSLNIYSLSHPNPYLLKFISEDHHIDDVVKDFYKPLHAIGKSFFKGTASVLNVWEKRGDFPKLTFMQGLDLFHPQSQNMIIHNGLLREKEFIRVQNEHGLHICTSQAEGFGHYIIEAMSTGAVVITTDAPPMNEYITDKRFLVRTKGHKIKNMGHVYEIDEEHLEEVIERALNMDENQLKEVGQKNREFFLNMREDFRERLEALFGRAN